MSKPNQIGTQAEAGFQRFLSVFVPEICRPIPRYFTTQLLKKDHAKHHSEMDENDFMSGVKIHCASVPGAGGTFLGFCEEILADNSLDQCGINLTVNFGASAKEYLYKTHKTESLDREFAISRRYGNYYHKIKFSNCSGSKNLPWTTNANFFQNTGYDKSGFSKLKQYHHGKVGTLISLVRSCEMDQLPCEVAAASYIIVLGPVLRTVLSDEQFKAYVENISRVSSGKSK
jgi:hypothetical protein